MFLLENGVGWGWAVLRLAQVLSLPPALLSHVLPNLRGESVDDDYAGGGESRREKNPAEVNLHQSTGSQM